MAAIVYTVTLALLLSRVDSYSFDIEVSVVADLLAHSKDVEPRSLKPTLTKMRELLQRTGASTRFIGDQASGLILTLTKLIIFATRIPKLRRRESCVVL